ncbi:hypothetical protein YC2023_009168 [Brassica napus]
MEENEKMVKRISYMAIKGINDLCWETFNCQLKACPALQSRLEALISYNRLCLPHVNVTQPTVYLSHLVDVHVGGRKKRKQMNNRYSHQCEVYACGVDLRYQEGLFRNLSYRVTNYAPSRLIVDGIHCTGRRKQMINFSSKFVLIS